MREQVRGKTEELPKGPRQKVRFMVHLREESKRTAGRRFEDRGRRVDITAISCTQQRGR